MQLAQLLGITKYDIQQIFENTLKDFKESKTRIIYLDASYLYTFHLDDFVEVRKFNLLGRYYANRLIELSKQDKPNLIEYEIALADNSKYCQSWHTCLETWLDDKYVTLGYRKLKPIAISRTFDRITNEGMEMIARSIVGGGDITSFKYRMIGDADVSGDTPSPSARVLGNEIDRIDVTDNPEGGSLSRDGTTVYSIGNHSKSVPTPDNEEFTECGMANSDSELTDKLLDYSIFADPIPHVQNADAPGSTTVIYMCSA
jgi:hypothetical protein